MNNHTTPASTTPSGTQATYTLYDLERIEKTITSAPVPEQPLSQVDAIKALAPALSRARSKGHSLASLVQLCAAQGLHASERSVSRAINMARASKTTKKKTVTGASPAT